MRSLFSGCPINSSFDIGKYLEKKRDYIKDFLYFEHPYKYMGKYGSDNDGIIRMLDITLRDPILSNELLIQYINIPTLIEIYIQVSNNYDSVKSSQLIQLIADLVKNNTDLKVFAFTWFKITLEQFGILVEPLKLHKNIEILDLTLNPIEDEGAKYLSEVLLVNNSIRYLELYHNEINQLGAKYLHEAMKINKTLLFMGSLSDPLYKAANLADNNRKIYKINRKYFLKYLHWIGVLKNIHIRNDLYKRLLSYVILTNIINISYFEDRYKKYLITLLC